MKRSYRRYIWFTVIILPVLLLYISQLTSARGMSIYVSPKGNDKWTGELSTPNSAKTDGPVASLTRARDIIRERRNEESLPKGPVTVYLEAGIYELSDSLELGAIDSGTPESPVVISAQPGVTVRLIGGNKLDNWKPVTDPAVLARLDSKAASKVLQADLKSAGVTDFGNPAPVGGTQAQLVFNNKYMTLARYPNKGEWEHIANIPQGGTLYKTEYDNHYGRWTYSGDRPNRWKDVSELWVHGYWVWDWADQYQKVQKLDLQTKEVWPEPPMHFYGYRRNQRFYYLNILEELDSPGEFYIDRKSGTIYFWPPSDIRKAEVLFPQLKKPVIRILQANNINIRNLTFEATHDTAVDISSGSFNEIAGCTFRNIGGDVAVVLKGSNNGIRSSDIYEIAGTAVDLTAGDKATLKPGNNYAINNEIYNAGQVYRTNHGAFVVRGVGNKISHCYVHDLPHHAIAYEGNEHIIEYCDFTRIAEETGDVGVIYTMADWTNMGEEIRYNYFHNVHGPGQLGCFTVYPDLPCGGINLHHNIFYDVDQVFHTNSGRGMVIENNLFLNCTRGMSFSKWTQDYMFLEGGPWKMYENLQKVNYDKPPYVTRYPILKNLADDYAKGREKLEEVQKPKDNIIRKNISSGNWFARVDPSTSLEQVKIQNNIVADPVVLSGSVDGSGESKDYRNGDKETEATLGKMGNIMLKNKVAVDDKFQLLDKSLAKRIGFQPIPFGKIGLYKDQYRKKLPVSPAAPLVEPESQTFLKDLTVKISRTPQVGQLKTVIRYTLDGTEPSRNSPVYTKPIKLTRSAKIRAAAFANDGARVVKSDSAGADYRFLNIQAGEAYLSDLLESDLFCYISCWKKDKNHLDAPIKINGVEYPKGILLHPDKASDGNYGRVTYALEGQLAKVKTFTATVGIEDAIAHYNMGSATFIVEAFRNGKWEKVLDSGIVKLGDPGKKVTANISGAAKIRLITTDAGDGISCDHAVWANPLLK